MGGIVDSLFIKDSLDTLVSTIKHVKRLTDILKIIIRCLFIIEKVKILVCFFPFSVLFHKTETKNYKFLESIFQRFELIFVFSKSTRSTRVASPVTTSYKGTPTRRSAAAAAAAALNTTGRSSPSTTNSSSRTNEPKETKDNTTKKELTQNTATSTSNTEIHNSSLSNSSTGSTTTGPTTTTNNNNNENTNHNANDASTAAGRRKLRSSGRLGVDDFPAVEKVQRSTSNKSPSPVTIMNENANSYNNEAEPTTTTAVQPTSGTTLANPKLPLLADAASELSNSSMVDSDSNITPSINLSLSDFFPGTRKKRNRQAQQQLQEQLDLINEIDT